MENKTSSALSVNNLQPASNYDELFMHQRSVFADNLKDLRNIRKQLYSAAEYFEFQYCGDDGEDPLFIDSLKDYVSRALISTVDHLGSVADKVNNLLDQNVKEVSETNLRLSRIQQRVQTCEEYRVYQGLAQQSLVIEIPKYHKHYLLPDARFTETVEAFREKPNPPISRRGHSRLASRESPSSFSTFSFTRAATNKQLGKRSVSPLRFPLKRSKSVASQSVGPIFPDKHVGYFANRSISPNSSNSRQQFPLQPQGSGKLYIHPERDGTKEIDVYSQKTKSMLKALLSIHKSKKDGRLYRYPGYK